MTIQELSIVELSQKLSELVRSARQLRDSPNLDLHHPRKVSPNYETELIQLAASAFAALMDLRLQRGESHTSATLDIAAKIYQERTRQDDKFGMPQNLDPLVWVAILLEELAEVAEEIVE